MSTPARAIQSFFCTATPPILPLAQYHPPIAAPGALPRAELRLAWAIPGSLQMAVTVSSIIDAEPAGFLIGAQREFCRTWPNQQTVTVQGSHFLPEDPPEAVGEATARFVAKVLAGQIRVSHHDVGSGEGAP